MCGYGDTDADTAILKYNLSLETAATISGVTDATRTYYMSSACDTVTGYVLQPYDNADSNLLGYMSKVNCSSDVVTTAVSLGYKVGGPSALLIFRDLTSYIWTGQSANPSILKFDIATDAITSTFTVFASQPFGNNAHQVVCDGENQAQSMNGALLCNATAAMVSRRHRQFDYSRSWVIDLNNPIGSATDLWSMC